MEMADQFRPVDVMGPPGGRRHPPIERLAQLPDDERVAPMSGRDRRIQIPESLMRLGIHRTDDVASRGQG